MVFVAMGMIYDLFEGLVASHFIPFAVVLIAL
jgi:hypothetical protein